MHVPAALQRISERAHSTYGHIFAVDEISTNAVLQWMMGAALLFFFLTFSQWVGMGQNTAEAAANGSALCWPFFQDCSHFYFLKLPPYGYSQAEFYMALYGVMLVAAWAMWRRKWELAHAIIGFLLAWEVLVVLFTYRAAAPYYYYHIALTAILLFARHKEYFLKVAFVVMYFLSATIKFNDGWVLGTYFTSLQNGLPIFPNILTPLLTNFVIFTQTIGAWFLLSRNRFLKNLMLVDLAIFHLYSGTLVMYTYPTAALVPLLILFGPLSRYTAIPFTGGAWRGWVVIAVLVVCQIIGFAVPGDRRITLENNRWGMFMFEANHQCIAESRVYYSTPRQNPITWESPPGTPCNGFYCLVEQSITTSATSSIEERRYESGTAWNRCDPYDWWTQLTSLCKKYPNIERIAFQFDHSINGGPFYRIVDLPNICGVKYEPFVHNPWIKLPPEAPIVGYPVMNSYHY